MKALPKKQHPFDWVTQRWNIALGKKASQGDSGWLLGPIGAIGESAGQFVQRIADENKLSIERNKPGSGLVESFDEWAVSASPQILEFYRRTIDFALSVDMTWTPGFGSLGRLVAKLFSRRIQQLNLPQGSNREIGFKSDFIKLIDCNGVVQYTIWLRTIATTGEVVFFGIYTTCRIPSGEVCVKVICPLPCGSATVIFRPQSDKQGNLALISSGRKDGDPGFYFIVEDSQGCLWKHYLPSFRESILVSAGGDGNLTAEHTLRLWSLQVYKMRYSMLDRKTGIAN